MGTSEFLSWCTLVEMDDNLGNARSIWIKLEFKRAPEGDLKPHLYTGSRRNCKQVSTILFGGLPGTYKDWFNRPNRFSSVHTNRERENSAPGYCSVVLSMRVKERIATMKD